MLNNNSLTPSKIQPLTKHQDFNHIHFSLGLITQVLLYFTALNFRLFVLFRDILVKTQSHADLVKVDSHVSCATAGLYSIQFSRDVFCPQPTI